MTLEVRDLVVDAGSVRILHGVTMTAPAERVTSVLGSSGAGKTTLLRTVAGLEPVAGGLVRVDGTDVTRTPTHRRGVGLMFQDHALFPHLDVRGNVAFGLRMKGWDARERERRVDEVLEMVGLGALARRRVQALSGGEQQRVALARSLAPEPSVLMLDEPLGSLDRALRDRLLRELSGLFDELGLTVVVVTHDQAEAFDLASHVVLMRGGRVVQAGSPAEVWRMPADEETARLLGHANVVDGTRAGRTIRLPWGEVESATAGPDGACRVLLRSDGLSVVAPANPVPTDRLTVAGVVRRPSFRGDHVVATVEVSPDQTLEVLAPSGARITPGERVLLLLDPSAVVPLPAEV